MADTTIIEFRQAMANMGGADGSSVGKSSGEAGKSTTEQGSTGEGKKEKKSIVGGIGKVLTSVLGIQVTFAAMLRQSQIATGFLGAVFQVLGAILDSFLLSFAPQLFAIVEHLSKFIPVARRLGEELALKVGDLWAKIVEFVEYVKPPLMGAWEQLKAVVGWFSELAPIWKQILVAAYVLPRMLAFLKVGQYIGMGKMITASVGKLLVMHRAKSAGAKAGGGMAKGAMSMLMMIPHAKIIMIAIAVIAVVGTAIWAIFKNKDKGDNAEGAIDISGQAGKRYLPSQASQLGGTLNESMSGLIQPFTDAVQTELVPPVAALEEVMAQLNPTAVAVTEEFSKLATALPGTVLDMTGLIQTGTDATIQRQIESQDAIMAASNTWVSDIAKATGAQIGGYDLLLTGTDASAMALQKQAEATDKAAALWKTKVSEAGATMVEGATQSKNQFVDTTGIMETTATEMSDRTRAFLDQSFALEAERAVERSQGGMSFDAFLNLFAQDAKAMGDAAIKSKEAAISLQLASVTMAQNSDLALAAEKLAQEEIRDASNVANDKMLSYLSSMY